MQRRDELKLIQERVPITEVLAGLAEEAAELAQAALKLRRVYTQENPTPVSEDVAMEHLYEEIADVELYVKVLDVNKSNILQTTEDKLARWVKRLEEKKSGGTE